MSRTAPGETRERVYRFVREQLLKGLPPTVREVQDNFGFRAVETAREHLELLVREGKLIKEEGQSRGYRLPGSSSRDVPTVFVPLLGRVQAGALNAAIENHEGHVAVQTRRSRDKLFALRVRGESMTGAGILPGDIVIVRCQSTAESGEIVVALIEDEATVKTLYAKGGKIELRPQNPAFSSLCFDADAVTILGKVMEVRRYLDQSSSHIRGA